MDDAILTIKGLSIHYPTSSGIVRAVDSVDLSLPRGGVVGLVGESGCGKSTLGLAILKLMRPPGQIVSGDIVLDGENLIDKDEAEMRKVRGPKVSMVFQDPMTSLNPLIRLDRHFLETIAPMKTASSKKAAMARVNSLVEHLGISPRASRNSPMSCPAGCGSGS